MHPPPPCHLTIILMVLFSCLSPYRSGNKNDKFPDVEAGSIEFILFNFWQRAKHKGVL